MAARRPAAPPAARRPAAAPQRRQKRSRKSPERRRQKAKRATQQQQRIPKSTRQWMRQHPGGYGLLHGPPGAGRGDQRRGREASQGTKCTCLSLAYSSCKKHPSRTKVRTGHFLVQRDAGKTRRRAVWVPKVLVDKGIITVKEDVKFRVNKVNGKAL